MVKTIRQLEDELRDIIRGEVSDDSDSEKTLEEVFKKTLDNTTPEKSGDLRDNQNKDTSRRNRSYWI